MLFTNTKTHGGDFFKIVKEEFIKSKDVTIASGYVSLDVINKFKGDFQRIASNGGEAKLLVGMAFYEGLTYNKLETLKDLSKELEAMNNKSGVYVSYSEKYHGKVYCFQNDHTKNVYLGSSNFSTSGLSGNIECTSLIVGDTKQKVVNFLEFIFHKDNAVSILQADITVPGTKKYSERIKIDTLDKIKRYNPQTIDKKKYKSFDFPLSRVVNKGKSNLNVYFGRGRWSRTTGKVTPRPWYEVELIANRKINSQNLYPQGNFLGYTDDGYVIPMKTSGDYYKNIRSQGSLQILGQWIKGKLQKSGVLIPLTPVTQDTLDAYGNDKISFYKIRKGKYYIEF